MSSPASATLLPLTAWAWPLSLLSPVSPEPSFDVLADLERQLCVRPRPGAATAAGPVADVEPDWATARESCARVLAVSRDLRAAVGWTRCALSLEGLPGLATGLGGLAEWLHDGWSDVHPRVDADDPAADERRHLLLNLSPDAAPSQPTLEAESLARALRTARVGTDAQREPVTVRDLDHATIAWDALGASVLTSVDQALEALRRIDVAFHRETGQGLRLNGLQRLLERVGRACRQAADAAPGGSTNVMAATGGAGDAHEAGPADAASVAASDATTGPCSRADAAQRLLALARWVRCHEPSSPAPLLIERAAALLQMDFAEIVRTLLPAARAQVEALAGLPLDPDPR